MDIYFSVATNATISNKVNLSAIFSLFPTVSTICEGRRLYAAAAYWQPANKGYNWSSSSTVCSAEPSSLLKTLPEVTQIYVNCTLRLLQTISDITKTHVRAWSADCANASHCGQYEANYFDSKLSSYIPVVARTWVDFANFALCSKGMHILVCSICESHIMCFLIIGWND